MVTGPDFETQNLPIQIRTPTISRRRRGQGDAGRVVPEFKFQKPAHSNPHAHDLICPGDEAKVMLDAHCEAGMVVGIPFAHKGLYDFGSHGNMTAS